MEELQLIQKGEEERNVSQEQSALEDNRPVAAQISRRNPPARNTSRFWFERFLAVIQRQNPSVIDSSFLSQIAPNNEGKLLAQLKFLHVIDEQGKPTSLLPTLNMIGSEQKKGFQQMLRDSYGDLMSEIVVEKAVPDDVVNFFIRKYAFTRDKAINASKFFLYLTEKASMPVSADLSSLLTEKSSGNSQSQSGTTTITSVSSVSSSLVPRVNVQTTPRSIREQRSMSANSLQRKTRLNLEAATTSPTIQTVINIQLDKDTPKEYWDRVLALIGERKDEVQTEGLIPSEVDAQTTAIT